MLFVTSIITEKKTLIHTQYTCTFLSKFICVRAYIKHSDDACNLNHYTIHTMQMESHNKIGYSQSLMSPQVSALTFLLDKCNVDWLEGLASCLVDL